VVGGGADDTGPTPARTDVPTEQRRGPRGDVGADLHPAEGRGAGARRGGGGAALRLRRLRLIHPFPSLLDGLVTAAIAAVAGAAPTDVVRLGLAMTSLQAAIGTVNDLADRVADVGRPEKPLVAGVVTTRSAATVAVLGAALGLGLSAMSGAATLLVGTLGLVVGLAYDLRLKRTPWAWLPYVLGIPLIPIFAWLGATGSVPPELGIIAVLAGLAGGAISLANALVDPAADAAAGVRTPVVALGMTSAWRWLAGLVSLVLALALLSLWLVHGAGPGIAVAVVGGVVTGGGVITLRAGSVDRRERGWELLAAGFAMTGAGWVWAIAEQLAS
jgi:4-hydroxybenzoate polyprenyltransferase